MNAQIFPQADDAQRDRLKLAVLLDQTVDALPADTDPAEKAVVAGVLIGQTLAGAVRIGLLPVCAHAGALMACQATLKGLPADTSLAEFQAAAKAVLRESILGPNSPA